VIVNIHIYIDRMVTEAGQKISLLKDKMNAFSQWNAFIRELV